MKALVFTRDPYPPDERVERGLLLLSEMVDEILFVAPKGHENIPEYIPSNVSIKYISLFRPFTISIPIISSKFIREYKPEIAYFHNFPPMMRLFNKIKKSPIYIVDKHELWVELSREFSSNQFIKNINHILLHSWESAEVRLPDKVIIPTIEMGQYLSSRYKIPINKFIEIQNVIDLNTLSEIKYSNLAEGFYVTYTGSLDKLRILDKVIEAFKWIDQKDIKLLIVGGKPKNRYDYLKRYTSKLGLEEKVIFTGQVPFDFMLGYIAQSEICLVPHKCTTITQIGFPNKITYYMALGKPVITTPLKSILSRISDGICIWDGKDPKKLAELILKLYHDDNLRSKLGARGKDLVYKKFSWGVEEKKLRAFYQSIL